jgi:hypothetical protein
MNLEFLTTCGKTTFAAVSATNRHGEPNQPKKEPPEGGSNLMIKDQATIHPCRRTDNIEFQRDDN